MLLTESGHPLERSLEFKFYKFYLKYLFNEFHFVALYHDEEQQVAIYFDLIAKDYSAAILSNASFIRYGFVLL